MITLFENTEKSSNVQRGTECQERTWTRLEHKKCRAMHKSTHKYINVLLMLLSQFFFVLAGHGPGGRRVVVASWWWHAGDDRKVAAGR